jgi:hypothetical protein
MVLINAEISICNISAIHAGVSLEGIGCTTIHQHPITFHELAKQRDLFV